MVPSSSWRSTDRNAREEPALRDTVATGCLAETRSPQCGIYRTGTGPGAPSISNWPVHRDGKDLAFRTSGHHGSTRQARSTYRRQHASEKIQATLQTDENAPKTDDEIQPLSELHGSFTQRGHRVPCLAKACAEPRAQSPQQINWAHRSTYPSANTYHEGVRG